MEWLIGACAVVIAVGTAAAILRRGVRWMLSTVRKISRLADDLLGEPGRPGHPERLGLMARVASLDDRLAVVERLVQPGGGASVKDRREE